MTVSVCGAEPLAGVTVSQLASSAAVKLRLPPPVFVTLSVLAAGFAPPAVPLKASDAGVTASAGAGSTTSVTVTSRGEPAAPADVTVTLPV